MLKRASSLHFDVPAVADRSIAANGQEDIFVAMILRVGVWMVLALCPGFLARCEAIRQEQLCSCLALCSGTNHISRE